MLERILIVRGLRIAKHALLDHSAHTPLSLNFVFPDDIAPLARDLTSLVVHWAHTAHLMVLPTNPNVCAVTLEAIVDQLDLPPQRGSVRQETTARLDRWPEFPVPAARTVLKAASTLCFVQLEATRPIKAKSLVSFVILDTTAMKAR